MPSSRSLSNGPAGSNANWSSPNGPLMLFADSARKRFRFASRRRARASKISSPIVSGGRCFAPCAIRFGFRCFRSRSPRNGSASGPMRDGGETRRARPRSRADRLVLTTIAKRTISICAIYAECRPSRFPGSRSPICGSISGKRLRSASYAFSLNWPKRSGRRRNPLRTTIFNAAWRGSLRNCRRIGCPASLRHRCPIPTGSPTPFSGASNPL